jgi:hypothetical protein
VPNFADYRKWQATLWPGAICFSTGSSLMQRSWA